MDNQVSHATSFEHAAYMAFHHQAEGLYSFFLQQCSRFMHATRDLRIVNEHLERVARGEEFIPRGSTRPSSPTVPPRGVSQGRETLEQTLARSAQTLAGAAEPVHAPLVLVPSTPTVQFPPVPSSATLVSGYQPERALVTLNSDRSRTPLQPEQPFYLSPLYSELPRAVNQRPSIFTGTSTASPVVSVSGLAGGRALGMEPLSPESGALVPRDPMSAIPYPSPFGQSLREEENSRHAAALASTSQRFALRMPTRDDERRVAPAVGLLLHAGKRGREENEKPKPASSFRHMSDDDYGLD